MLEGKDLTKGNLFNNMIKFCLPLLFTNLLNSIYNIVDGVWIGRLVGDNGLSATTNCWPIILIAFSILDGITVTTSVMVAQHYASKDRDKIKDIVTPLYIIAFILGLLTCIVLTLTCEFLFKAFNTPLEVLDYAKGYITIYLIGYIFDFVAFTMINSIRAIGNSKTPLIILAITEITNIVLDPILIKCGLGVNGAALATVISMFTCLSLSYCYIRKSELLNFNIKKIKFEKSFLKQVSKLGIPMMIQQLAAIFTIVVEVSVSNSMGIIGGSAYGIVSKFQEVVWVLSTAINEMITIVVGQFIGKKEYNRLKDVMKNGIKLTIFPMILVGAFVFFCSEVFAQVFTESEEVIKVSAYYMHIVGIGYILAPLCQLLYGFVLGNGNTRYTFFVSLLASAVEIILIFKINSVSNNVFASLGNGITMWYVVEIIMFAIYYYSNEWWKKDKQIETV